MMQERKKDGTIRRDFGGRRYTGWLLKQHDLELVF